MDIDSVLRLFCFQCPHFLDIDDSLAGDSPVGAGE